MLSHSVGGRGGHESGGDSGEIRRRGSQKKRYSLTGFEAFCRDLRTENGEQLKIEPFERRILKDHFAGVIEEVVILPKKNGKTTLFAALGLYHLENWPQANVVIVASSKDQASILFRQAWEMVTRSNLENRFDVRDGYKLIRLQGQKAGPQLKVLPGDAKTVDGALPTLGLVDELHRHPSGELYGVLRDGCDARDGRMVTMSTAGLKEESPLGQLRLKAQKLPSYSRKGTYSQARSEDGSFVLHEWSLSNTDNLDDLKLVKKANPASWQTIEKLRRRKESPTMTPSRWARFACGVWTEGEDPWLEAKDWDRLAVDIGHLSDGEPVWVAVDIGTNPGICLAAQRPSGRVVVHAEVFEGDVPLEVVENTLVKLSGAYEFRQVAYDRIFQRSAELLAERGLPMEEVPHSPERISLSSTTLKRLIGEEKLLHDGDKKLRAQVLAGATKETERGWRLVKSFRTRALIAMAMAVHQATQVQRTSVYESRDLGVFG